MKAQQDFFDPVTRKLKDDIRKHVQGVIDHLGYKGKALEEEQQWYDKKKLWDFTRKEDRTKMRSFYYHSWVCIFEKACLLDIRDGGAQEEVWWGLLVVNITISVWADKNQAKRCLMTNIL